ncbi:phytanoyl-CoA dioxygenase family protein [Sphingobacteriaceae bacterium AH-315-L07]|nr:phytanoyl-CoA dioxygenase family protein [Bacteroidia bacterium]MBN4052289.1 phytanoyl-CoA dioxygenase family protein [Sphingobacteriaceae bacterium AH-315-L07]
MHSNNKEDLLSKIHANGFAVIENVLDHEFIVKIKDELNLAIQQEAKYHEDHNYQDYGMVLLCSLYNHSFIKLFDNKRLIEPFNEILGEGCIVYAYTSSSMPPNSKNYSARIHKDCPRMINGYITNIGATILLDDFTEENGATWFLPNSHQSVEAPTESYFYENADRLVAKAGSVWYFDARLWHAGGKNKTDQWRHALTINMCRPWMKQRVDIPRAMMDMELGDVSQQALQKLGFHTQVPANYDEYYAPPEKRKYTQKAE